MLNIKVDGFNIPLTGIVLAQCLGSLSDEPDCLQVVVDGRRTSLIVTEKFKVGAVVDVEISRGDAVGNFSDIVAKMRNANVVSLETHNASETRFGGEFTLTLNVKKNDCCEFQQTT